MTYLTLEQKVAAKCCAIILSVDSNRGNEKQAAEFIAEEYKIDLDKLQAGEYIGV